MTDTPERIWAWFFTESNQDDLIKGGWNDADDRGSVEYTRADLAAPEWQDIKTAPKDGSDFLVLGQDGMAVAFWCDYEGGFVADLRGKGNSQHVVSPTRWMPLPKPPTPDT